MSDITFVMHDTYPTNYRSMTDYFKLAELSGFPIVRAAEMDVSDPSKCYIVSWFDVQNGGWQGAKARIILWNLEWASRLHPLDNVGYIAPNKMIAGVKEIWSPDAWFARQHGWRYVPVGSHIDLQLRRDDVPQDKLWDVTLQMYRDPQRRRYIINQMQAQGISIASDGWGDTRHTSLRNSRMMVHIHQHDNLPVIAPLRFAVAAAYAMPLISESVAATGIFTGCIATSTYDDLLRYTQFYLQNYDYMRQLRDMGLHMQHTLCVQNTFGSIVKAAV